MRLVGCLFALGISLAARAEPVPIAVAPFANRCFDAAQLAERVRAAAGDLPLSIGPAPRGSHQAVRVSAHAGAIHVEVVARDARGQQIGRAERLLPADVDCATALEVAALIVVRAALPLNWPRAADRGERAPPDRGPSERASGERNDRASAERNDRASAERNDRASAERNDRASGERNEHTSPERRRDRTDDRALAPSPAHAAATAPRASNAPSSTVAATPPRASSAAPPSVAATPPSPSSAASSAAPGSPAAPTGATSSTTRAAARGDTIVLPTRGPDRPFVGELAVAAYGAFALGVGGANLPGGELALGFHRHRFGAAARATVDGDWSSNAASSAGPIAVGVRRYTVALEAHADVRLRLGALRFAAGPTLPLYATRTTGLPHPRSDLVVSAAVTARILYRLDLGRVFVTGGVSADFALVREQLGVTGVGVVARAPLVWLGPLVSLGVNL